MEELVHILTLTEISLDSNMLGTLIMSYIFLLMIMFVSFVNIYSIDKYEFMNNRQKCVDLKCIHKIIYKYDKNYPKIVSKKTLLLQLIAYILTILLIALFVISLFINIDNALVVLSIVAILVFSFGCIIGTMYGKTTKNKKNK